MAKTASSAHDDYASTNPIKQTLKSTYKKARQDAATTMGGKYSRHKVPKWTPQFSLEELLDETAAYFLPPPLTGTYHR